MSRFDSQHSQPAFHSAKPVRIATSFLDKNCLRSPKCADFSLKANDGFLMVGSVDSSGLWFVLAELSENVQGEISLFRGECIELAHISCLQNLGRWFEELQSL
jgi:hypothetical protein